MRPRPIISACAFVVALLASCPTIAIAQTEPAKADAMRRYQEGIAAHDKGKDEEAYVKFSQAYVVVQAPRILFNLARTEQLTGRLVSAAGHYKDYIAWPEHPHVTAATREKARGFLADVRSQLGQIVIDAPAGATIGMDGEELAARTLAEPFDVTAGTHVIVGHLGGRSASVTVVAKAGFTSKAVIQFDAPSPPAPPPSAASVAPPAAPAPATRPETTTDTGTSATPEGFWSTRRFVGLAVTGAGLAVIGVSAVFAAKSNDAADRATTLQGSVGKNGCSSGVTPQCSQLADAYDSQSTNHTLNLVFLGVGAAAVATGLVVMLWPSASPARLVAAVPMLSPSGGGLQLLGAF